MGKPLAISIDQAWETWKACLDEKDRNSVFSQITSMVWDAGIYRLILESRQIKLEENPNNPKINNSVHRFIDKNFFESQAASIRRLTDDSYDLYGKRGVYSLIALIKDLKCHQDELTREKYFELRQIPYDIEMVRKEQEKYFHEHSRGQSIAVTYPKELSPEVSIEAHDLFDQLSGKNSTNRHNSDLVCMSVWENLENELVPCQQINEFVNKFIAHASTPESRALDNYQSEKLNIQYLWDMHKLLCEVIEFLTSFILSTLLMVFPTESSGFF